MREPVYLVALISINRNKYIYKYILIYYIFTIKILQYYIFVKIFACF